MNESYGNQEGGKSRAELERELNDLRIQVEDLKKLSVSSGENIDAPLGSDPYVDRGHMAEARRIEEEEIAPLLAKLAALDNKHEAQGELPLE